MLNNTSEKKRVAILGLGWLGEALAKTMIKKGTDVIGSTTSEEKTQRLLKDFPEVEYIKINSDAIIGNWNKFIKNVSILIVNIPPKRKINSETLYPAQISNIIKNTPKSIKVIFVSSTSVYGNSKIAHVETGETIPIKTSGKAVLKAEQLLQYYFGSHLTILRFAGLIGPDRLPGRFLAGKKNIENPNTPVNLIHQKDCIGLIEAIINTDSYGEIFNGCASIHPLRKSFYEKAAKALNLEVPHFKEDNGVSNMKIIDNSKSKRVLGYNYVYDNPEELL